MSMSKNYMTLFLQEVIESQKEASPVVLSIGVVENGFVRNDVILVKECSPYTTRKIHDWLRDNQECNAYLGNEGLVIEFVNKKEAKKWQE